MKRSYLIGIIILSAFAILINATSCERKSAQTSETLTLMGYIIDEHCFVENADPGADAKACLQMPACAATGYGIAVRQDNKYKFYFFDGEFFPAASGAQLMSIDLVDQSTRIDHMFISVTGYLTGDSKKAPDGLSYPVFMVSSMIEASEQK